MSASFFLFFVICIPLEKYAGHAANTHENVCVLIQLEALILSCKKF